MSCNENSLRHKKADARSAWFCGGRQACDEFEYDNGRLAHCRMQRFYVP